MFIVFLASLFNRLFFKLLLLNYARTFSVSRDFKEGDMGIFCIAVLWCFSCGISVILPLRYGILFYPFKQFRYSLNFRRGTALFYDSFSE